MLKFANAGVYVLGTAPLLISYRTIVVIIQKNLKEFQGISLIHHHPDRLSSSTHR